eukprot:GFYU01005428.1.p1 GENE.GFYU01005428.1~~GFYU01005428.1.p1  ORF type:complete len:542 (-),score=145.14 GFYU01005428.1:249-1874(-)
MAGGGIGTDIGEMYSRVSAVIYMFNLIVGAGALAMPLAFLHSGVILGLLFLGLIGFLSYVTVTFTIEAMGAANAIMKRQMEDGTYMPLGDEPSKTRSRTSSGLRTPEEHPQTGGDPNLSVDWTTPHHTPRPNDGVEYDEIKNEREALMMDPVSSSPNAMFAELPFAITKRTEMALMAEMFLGRSGVVGFYIVIIIYLYGDLAIYAASVPKSLAAVTHAISLGSWQLTDNETYYFYLILFCSLLVPFCFFNFQKSKYLQYSTMAIRNLAFFAMIILCLVYLGSHGDEWDGKHVPMFDFAGLPSLFGVSIYSFMCHHSLPSIVSPIKKKNKLSALTSGVFVAVYSAYSLLCMSAVFAFGAVETAKCGNDPGPPCKIQDLFTLNFSSYSTQSVGYMLSLFPVFTLSSNFPMIAITLRNNLALLMPRTETPQWYHHRVSLTIFTVVPPITIAAITHNIEFLVKITGSYAGLAIMYVVPCLLVMFARKMVNEQMGSHSSPSPHPFRCHVQQKHSSPFRHEYYIYVVLGWASFAVVFTTVTMAINGI